MGEKLSDLEQFYPDRMASRILGMGDVMSLIEKAEASIDKEQAQDMQKKLKKMDFDFNDYLTSMEQMNKMGGIGSILNMLPGMGSKMKDIEGMIDEKAHGQNEVHHPFHDTSGEIQSVSLKHFQKEPYCQRRRSRYLRSQPSGETV